MDDDVFDALVTQMREQRSLDLLHELNRRLFALPQWFFLVEPADARAAVQWVFPDGPNPAPALLAFTSRERAEAAAVALGLYPQGAPGSVIAVPVRDAVQWIAGPDSANAWLCFNLTRVDFPVYVEDAIQLLRQFEIRPGGIYSCKSGVGDYTIVKALVVEDGGVHARLYANRFKERPTTIDPKELQVEIGHVPLAEAGFRNWEPVLLLEQPVTDDELVGYRLWRNG